MRPEPGVRVTLLARELEVPYSGMLPGWIAGLYAAGECRVDLLPLAAAAGARLVHDTMAGLDPTARQVLCRRHPPLRYDVLSLDIGSAPRLEVPGAVEHALPVRPIGNFLMRLEAALARLSLPEPRLAVVGGGAAGVELAFALRHRLAMHGVGALVSVLAAGELLPRHGGCARILAGRALARRGIAAIAGAEVVRVEPGALLCADGRRIPCDLPIWATGAAPAPWLRQTGLALDPEGFLAVDAGLRSVSHPGVFAAGDTAAVLPHPREKAGVYAVRQGRPLADNLRRALRGGMPRPFTPQRRALALIGTGDGEAIASWGGLALAGRWVWRVKDRIDRRWIRRFRTPGLISGAEGMRCAGCGAKVPAEVLSRVMRRLRPAAGASVLLGLETPDDAAAIALPPGAAVLQSVDFFRAFLGDLHLFGRIAANHALGDIHAMGGRPVSALAIVTLPPAAPALLEADLHAMLQGALEVLEAAGAHLLGGHSAEGAETALGFAVTGATDPARLLRKGGLRPGDRLLLGKPLGTGVILAAAMRGALQAAWLEAALEEMQRPAGPVAAAMLAHGATACTDVTGFGLLGHLGEMLRPAGVAARLDPAAVPLLPGVAEALAGGIRSTLHAANAGAVADLLPPAALARPEAQPLLDPQTAGPLLAGLPADRAEACLAALRRRGIPAALIGEVEAGAPGIRFGAEPIPAPRHAVPAAD
jgi:selenide,water dikinase